MRSSLVVPYAPLVLYKIHSWSRYLQYHILDSMCLLLSNMVLHTQQAWSYAYRRDNHPTSSKGKDANSSVLLVD